MPLDPDHFRERGIGNFAADALCERMGAEVAIVTSGQFHRGLPAETVTLGQLDAACFSTANPGLTEVRGAQILAALERGLDPAIAEHRHPASRGTPVGIPQISGMIVEYDPGAAVGRRVQRGVVQGQPLDPNRLYRLAHTDAETIPDAGYLVLDEGQATRYEVPTIVREVMEDCLRRRPHAGGLFPNQPGVSAGCSAVLSRLYCSILCFSVSESLLRNLGEGGSSGRTARTPHHPHFLVKALSGSHRGGLSW